MLPILTIDFETRSVCDLPARGLDNYSSDPTTEILCLGYAFGSDEPQLWHPGKGQAMLDRVLAHVRSGGLVVAHNAAFELAIWNRVGVRLHGWPELRAEQAVDTMAMAYAMALPGNLEGACKAVGLDIQKDMAGQRVMRLLCRPRDDGTWHDDPALYEKLYAYCEQDVRAEQALYERLLHLSDAEKRLWLLDLRINQRGFKIDVPAVRAADALVRSEITSINERLAKLTDGAVTAITNPGQLKAWLREQHGMEIDSTRKSAVAELLAGQLPDAVRKVLLLRQDGARTSTAKLDKLLTRMSADGRVRGTKQYHGAATGRWAGRDVQPDNFPRPAEGVDYEDVIARIKRLDVAGIDNLYGPPLRLVAEAMRGLIIADDDCELFDGDFSNIEGRGLAWCAGEETKLEAFRAFDTGVGPDLYKVTYSRAFHTPVELVTKAQRQVGKVQELALGYQGSYGALCSMAAMFGIEVPPLPPKVWVDDLDHPDGGYERQPPHPWVKAWRDAHPKIVRWWYDLERAAKNAVLNPGVVYAVGPVGREVRYRVRGSFLWCQLPSGRVLCYPYPRIGEAKTPWGVKPDALLYKYVNQTTRKWEEGPTYGGSLAENVVQAICRDLLAEALERVETAGYPVVMHVHDSILAERRQGWGNLEEFKRLMAQAPAWAAGWPISVAAKSGQRWG